MFKGAGMSESHTSGFFDLDHVRHYIGLQMIRSEICMHRRVIDLLHGMDRWTQKTYQQSGCKGRPAPRLPTRVMSGYVINHRRGWRTPDVAGL